MNRHIALIFTVAFLVASCFGSTSTSTYVPTKEFLPAYTALVNAEEENGYQYQVNDDGDVEKVQCPAFGNEDEYYDIEETVRILNGLEVAQMHASDFYSYLEYMARQDYSMVPDDVIAAKKQLLPILQEMYILEKENEELDGLTTIMNSLGTGIYTIAKEYNPAESVAGVVGVVKNMANPIAIMVNSNGLSENMSKALAAEPLDRAKVAAFECYEQQRELQAENIIRLDQLKAEYLAYLTEFTPVYMKYMKEWERLSIEKDKAYLAVWSGRSAEGYSIAKGILEKYPANREAMLLKSLACINIAKSQVSVPTGDSPVLTLSGGNAASVTESQKYEFALEAQQTLENYIDLYPSKAAPALVLLGESELIYGNSDRAMSYFDQAAIEYPKRAAELKDMLNSYMLRTYLNDTPEGQYLMRLYCSTMEGYGWFSPNFHKALYWDSVGETSKASVEIYNHFFRRGNQGLYDCLLTDMDFCEDNLYRSFKSQFMESSVLNVSVEEDSHLFGENGIKVSLENNADINLENVRLYVCAHLKDMYIDEYEVVPCETISILSPGDVMTWPLDDFKIEDIVRLRAILMTDDRVCWVDDVTFKQSYAKKNFYGMTGIHHRSLAMFDDYDLSEEKIVDNLMENVSGRSVSVKAGWMKKMVGSKGDEFLTVELPRTVCLLDPVYSLGELSHNRTPSSVNLDGSVVKLEFKMEEGQSYEPLYIYSDFVNLKIDYDIVDGKMTVTDIAKI